MLMFVHMMDIDTPESMGGSMSNSCSPVAGATADTRKRIAILIAIYIILGFYVKFAAFRSRGEAIREVALSGPEELQGALARTRCDALLSAQETDQKREKHHPSDIAKNSKKPLVFEGFKHVSEAKKRRKVPKYCK